MTALHTYRKAAPFAATALLAALVAGAGTITAQTEAEETGADLTCALAVTETSRGLVIEGLVAAETAVSGSYELAVSRRGADMTQGGSFALGAGDSDTLGQIMMNGTATGLDAELTLTVAGQRLRCSEI